MLPNTYLSFYLLVTRWLTKKISSTCFCYTGVTAAVAGVSGRLQDDTTALSLWGCIAKRKKKRVEERLRIQTFFFLFLFLLKEIQKTKTKILVIFFFFYKMCFIFAYSEPL